MGFAFKVGPARAADKHFHGVQRGGAVPSETLHALDTSGRVIYVGSFSKTLLPTLRLGFLVAPPCPLW